MRSKLLMMSTAALLAGTLAAAGQSIQPGGGAQEKGQSSEGAREQAPKGAQNQMKRSEDRQGQKSQTQGQAQHDQDKAKIQTQGQADRDQDKAKGQAQRDQDKAKSQTQGQADRDQDKTKGQAQPDQDKAKSQTQGQAERDQDKTKGQAQRDQDKSKSQTQGQSQSPGQAQRDQDKTKTQTQGQAPREQDRQQGQIQRDQERTQQGAREGERGGNVSVSFTTEQRTKIRETVFKSNNAPRLSKVDFSLREGTVVPRTVRIVEVPDVIVEIHPEWRGYKYFIVNDELIIVESDTLRIVAVIDV
jgi:Protein of unknown function (DUF1236)